MFEVKRINREATIPLLLKLTLLVGYLVRWHFSIIAFYVYSSELTGWKPGINPPDLCVVEDKGRKEFQNLTNEFIEGNS